MIWLLWVVLLLLSWLVDLVGLFIVPIALYQAGDDATHLPGWAWPWDNVHDGINGDTARRPRIMSVTGFRRGFYRWVWLCLRNPGNGLGYWLGFVQAADVRYAFAGDEATSDQGHPGYLAVDAYVGAQHAACCRYYVYRYPWWPSKCLRIYIGWKINGMLHDCSAAEIVGVVNPFMTFELRPAMQQT